MKKMSKFQFLKYKKELQELYALGKKYDKEKDPEKQAVLKEEIIEKCEALKSKLKLQDCSEEEAQNLLGVSLDSSASSDADVEDEQNAEESDKLSKSS